MTMSALRGFWPDRVVGVSTRFIGMAIWKQSRKRLSFLVCTFMADRVVLYSRLFACNFSEFYFLQSVKDCLGSIISSRKQPERISATSVCWMIFFFDSSQVCVTFELCGHFFCCCFRGRRSLGLNRYDWIVGLRKRRERIKGQGRVRKTRLACTELIIFINTLKSGYSRK